MQISHNGNFIVTADEQGNVYHISSDFNHKAATKVETDSVLGIDVSANDNFVLTGGKSKKLLVWSINESDMEHSSDHGRRFSFTFLIIIMIMITTLLIGLEVNNSITSICSSCVSSLVITGCEDNNIYLWDLRKKNYERRMYGFIMRIIW